MGKITKKKLSDYFQDDKNFNKGNEFGESLIKKSVSRFGAGRSMLVSSDDILIAGNKSHKKLAEAGIENVIEIETDGKTAVVVKRTDIKSGTKKFHELALADNATSKANLTFDTVLIEDVLSEELMNEWGIEGAKKDVEEDGFNAVLPIKPITKPGDLFELDNWHKLICGDATFPENWKKLNPDKTFCCFTSPPYNVGKNAILVGNKEASKRKSLYDHNDDSELNYDEILSKSLQCAIDHCGGVAFNVQPLANNKVQLLTWIAEFADNFNEIITWNKGNAAPAMAKGVCSAAYEWIVIFSNKKSRTIPLSSWRGSLSNVYNAPPQRHNEFKERHAATFPIHLPSFVLSTLMNKSSGIVDCFMGTGTTIIAAEQLGRKAYGIELSPAYCDLIIGRYIKFKQEKSSGGSGSNRQGVPVQIVRNGKELSTKEVDAYLHQIEPKRVKNGKE